MKKWIALTLTFALALSLCACGTAGTQQQPGTETTAASAKGLMVGFAKQNITFLSDLEPWTLALEEKCSELQEHITCILFQCMV